MINQVKITQFRNCFACVSLQQSQHLTKGQLLNAGIAITMSWGTTAGLVMEASGASDRDEAMAKPEPWARR